MIKNSTWGLRDVCKIVVRPVVMYVAEDMGNEGSGRCTLDTAEIRTLRWMCGVTKLDVWSHQAGCVESSSWMCGVIKLDVWSHQAGCVESSSWMCGVIKLDVWSHQAGCVESSSWMCGVIKLDVWSHKAGYIEQQKK